MISRDTWIKIIRDFEERPFPNDLKDRLIDIPLDVPLNRAIALLGPRRAGKTYTMFLLIKRLIESGVEVDRIVHINFESLDLAGVSLADVKNFLNIYFEIHPKNFGKDLWFFLDEVQGLDGWEVFVRDLIDRGVRTYISGSSSKFLSREIATQLRGRCIGYEIYPLCFKEFLSFKNIVGEKFPSTRNKSTILNCLREYLKFGGYPEIVIFPEAREKILKEIIDVVIERDIIERYGVRNSRVLRLLIKALASSKRFSVHKFYNFLKSSGIRVSKNTLYTYLEALNDSFVTFPVRRFSRSYKDEETSLPKVYFVDNGLLTVQGVDDEGKLMENLVFVELLRRFGLEKIRYFLHNDKEVDFIIKDGNVVTQLVQVSYSIEDFETREREVKPLIKASELLDCNSMLILTWDTEEEIKVEGKAIKLLPLWKWLLT
ncbi:MAG: ATP-binding protein [Nitrososphaeria archaeon]